MSKQTAERAKAYFESSGWRCAESVLLAIAEHQQLQSDLIPRMATGFCSGLARTCGTCGAVNGAILALNLVYGRSSPEESADPCYTAVQALLSTFQDRFNTINCQELLDGCDLATEAGQQAFVANNYYPRCAGYVYTATAIALEIIDTRIPPRD